MFTRTHINDRAVCTDGVQFFKPCLRCDGTGTMPFTIYEGKCFACAGGRVRSMEPMTLAEAEKWTVALNKAADAREAKRIAAAAKAAEVYFAWKAANAEILAQIAEFGTWGILEDFAAQIEGGVTLTEKQLALAAKLIAREQEKREANSKCSTIGEIGKRMVFEGTIRKVSSYETDFGLKFTVVIDVDGNDVVTKGTGVFCYDAEEGKAVKFKATVDSFGEFAGKPQTIVKRAVSL